MRFVCVVLLLCLVAAPARADTGSYYYYWSTTKSVNLATIVVTVEGGTLAEQGNSADRTWGYVRAEATRDCIVINWSAETDSGIPLRDRVQWMDQCDPVFVPWIATTGGVQYPPVP